MMRDKPDFAHICEIIIKAAGAWEASNAGKPPPENSKMRALAARYGFSYELLMERKGSPIVH